MSKTYCGIGDVPKGQKRGSMKECAEKGQIRYYGEKKIDPITMKLVEEKKMSKKGDFEKQMSNLKIKISGLIGQRDNIKKRIAKEDNKKEKSKLQTELDNVEHDIEKSKNKLNLIKKTSDVKKNLSRTISKKSSKKSSKKPSKKPSKKSSKKLSGGRKKTSNKFAGGSSQKEQDFIYICD
jgi:hypothetical protein